jgi:hypothetical protein
MEEGEGCVFLLGVCGAVEDLKLTQAKQVHHKTRNIQQRRSLSCWEELGSEKGLELIELKSQAGTGLNRRGR